MVPELITVTCLLVKHMVADFMLQTKYQVVNKGRYGHFGGILHSGIHILLTAPILWWLLGDNLPLIGGILAVEFLVHYHIDYIKENLTRSAELTPDRQGFWIGIGVDQLAHQLTYVAMTAYLFR